MQHTMKCMHYFLTLIMQNRFNMSDLKFVKVLFNSKRFEDKVACRSYLLFEDSKQNKSAYLKDNKLSKIMMYAE